MENFTDSNRKTLESYEYLCREYSRLAGLGEGMKSRLEQTVEDLDQTAKIFEFGSGPGDDALYLQELGYRVDCSDPVPGFVAILRARGLDARQFDVLRDPLPAGAYQLVCAQNVLHHFNPVEAALVVDKVLAALSPGGHFVFTTAEGAGESWGGSTPQHPVYFCFWQAPELSAMLSSAGFEVVQIRQYHAPAVFSGQFYPWLHAFARKPV